MSEYDMAMSEYRKHLRGAMDAVSGELAKAGTPVGMRERTLREQNNMFRKLAAAPPEERQAIMVGIAEKAGHQTGEPEPCELCKFLGDKAADIATST